MLVESEFLPHSVTRRISWHHAQRMMLWWKDIHKIMMTCLFPAIVLECWNAGMLECWAGYERRVSFFTSSAVHLSHQKRNSSHSIDIVVVKTTVEDAANMCHIYLCLKYDNLEITSNVVLCSNVATSGIRSSFAMCLSQYNSLNLWEWQWKYSKKNWHYW